MNATVAKEPHDREEVRLVRRYANRKLYDTSLGGFTTIRELEALALSGTNVVIVNHETGMDITQRILGRLHLTDRRSAELAELRGEVERLTRLVAALVEEAL